MPLKICPKCSKSTGPRAYKCPGCGYEFIKKNTDIPDKVEVVETQKPKYKKKIEQPANENRTLVLKQIVTPAGAPPVYPEGYNKGSGWSWSKGEHWNQKPTIESIEKWAKEIHQSGGKVFSEYTNEAIKYWARHFWNITSEDYRHVCKIIDRWYFARVKSPAKQISEA